jgi:enoyl-CoA hydratase
MEEHTDLLIEADGGIMIATLNRPEKYNAINIAMMRTYWQALERFRDTPELKVLLIRSSGKYFSAGADLKEPFPGKRPETASGLREMHRRMPADMRRIWDEMEAIEKPIVVAHHGPCMGASLEMSLSCDFRLASTEASYALPEGRFGILPATNGVSRLTRLIGPAWARQLVMGNFTLDAQEALISGLVQKVFPAETFEADVMAYCRHLEQQNPEQMGAAKITIELAWDLGAQQAGAVERLANSALMLNPEYLKGRANYISKIGGK